MCRGSVARARREEAARERLSSVQVRFFAQARTIRTRTALTPVPMPDMAADARDAGDQEGPRTTRGGGGERNGVA